MFLLPRQQSCCSDIDIYGSSVKYNVRHYSITNPTLRKLLFDLKSRHVCNVYTSEDEVLPNLCWQVGPPRHNLPLPFLGNISPHAMTSTIDHPKRVRVALGYETGRVVILEVPVGGHPTILDRVE